MTLSNLNNMALEDVLQELARYGRPTVHQLAVSASGNRAAGIWNVEVWIPSKWNLEAPSNVSVTGRRMIGRGKLIEAAIKCLNECQELAEGELSSWYSFVSEDEIKRIEEDKNNLKKVLT